MSEFLQILIIFVAIFVLSLPFGAIGYFVKSKILLGIFAGLLFAPYVIEFLTLPEPSNAAQEGCRLGGIDMVVAFASRIWPMSFFIMGVTVARVKTNSGFWLAWLALAYFFALPIFGSKILSNAFGDGSLHWVSSKVCDYPLTAYTCAAEKVLVDEIIFGGNGDPNPTSP